MENGHEVTVLTGIPNYPSGDFYDGYSFWQSNLVEDYYGVNVKDAGCIPEKIIQKLIYFLIICPLQYHLLLKF